MSSRATPAVTKAARTLPSAANQCRRLCIFQVHIIRLQKTDAVYTLQRVFSLPSGDFSLRESFIVEMNGVLSVLLSCF
jgi:hypothetical protein